MLWSKLWQELWCSLANCKAPDKSLKTPHRTVMRLCYQSDDIDEGRRVSL